MTYETGQMLGVRIIQTGGMRGGKTQAGLSWLLDGVEKMKEGSGWYVLHPSTMDDIS